MIRAFSRALGQLSDPSIKRVLVICLLGTFVIYGLLVAVIGWVLTDTTLLAWPGAEAWADWLLGIGATLLSLMLFPGIMTAAIGLMLDPVAEAVEQKHYPELGPGRNQPLSEGILSGMKLLALTVVLNLLALPIYFIFTLLGVVLFYMINGYLIGREYYELVALRHQSPSATAQEMTVNRTGIIMAGAFTTFLLTIPVVNIVAPVLGVAAMVHLRQRWAG